MVKDIEIAQKMIATRSSAKDRGYEYNISFKKMKQLMTRKTCYYTGTKFNKKNPRSIDRVVNSIGYIDSNVVACTVQINSFKTDVSVELLNKLTNKVNQFIGDNKPSLHI